MNNRVLVILLSAFLVAAGCSYLVYRIVGTRLMLAHPQTTGVIVAAKDVKLGSILHDSDLGIIQIAGAAPKGAVLRRQDAIGRAATSNIYQGETILDNRLAPVGSGGGLAATIPPGMRASAVKVDEVVDVGGFATPGTRVDVLISGNPPGTPNPNEGLKVKTLLQNIQVLSAGTDIQQDSSDGKPKQVQVVNLLVTPEQAEQLALASQMRIQLVLRNPLDKDIAEPPVTAMASLFADKDQPPAPPKPRPTAVRTAALPKPTPPRPYTIQVFNGTKQSEAKFDSAGGK
jgi:pilus assembly protein CpaB